MNSQVEHIRRFVKIAATSRQRSGVNELLREIALQFKADGVILWRETPWSELDASPPKGKLFVQGAWFAGREKCSLYDLPLESATGAAVLDGHPSIIVDISDPLVYKRDGYLRRAGISSFCAVPLRYLDHRRGSLNLYFERASAVTDADLVALSEIAPFIPLLYHVLIGNLRWSLADSVNRILQETLLDERYNDWVGLCEAAQFVCNSIAAVFDAIEVSIFLSDPLLDPREYKLAATTWPLTIPFHRKVRTALRGDGLTGWVLAEGKPITIFDLAEFDHHKGDYAAIYPGIEWADSLDICRSVKKILGSADLPPITFMASPVIGRGPISKKKETLGVMRCCTAKSSPYYFGDTELELLRFVADQLGAAMGMWLTSQQLSEENAAWQRFVDRIAELNKFVEQEVQKDNPDERSVYQKALEVTTDVVARDVISDVRRLSDDRAHLYFYAMHGDAWEQGAAEEVKVRKTRTFSVLEKPPESAGARVVQTGKPYSIPDIFAPGISYSPTFEMGRWITCAPISVAGDIFGVLDIRGVGVRPFPLQAAPIATLLAQQLGLYHYLVGTIALLRRQPLALAQSYQDFNHQLRSPILQVHARAQECARLAGNMVLPAELQRELMALRGLAGKARSVSHSLGLFAELAQEGKLKVSRSPVDSSLGKYLIEMAEDARLISDPDSRLNFVVKREGFMQLDDVNVELDKDLFLQAVVNLLDNASKYSYPSTTIEMSTSITKSLRFRLSVKNVGIEIRRTDIDACKARGWRSEEAQAVTGEGSGLGLWIVNSIMEAHGGELVVEATNRWGETDVLLLFPISS